MCSVERYSSSSCSRSLSAFSSTRNALAPSCASRTVAPLTCGSLAERLVDAAAHRADVDADALEHAGDDALGLVEQRAQQVLGRDLGVARVARQRLRGAERLLGLAGELVRVECHVLLPLRAFESRASAALRAAERARAGTAGARRRHAPPSPAAARRARASSSAIALACAPCSSSSSARMRCTPASETPSLVSSWMRRSSSMSWSE